MKNSISDLTLVSLFPLLSHSQSGRPWWERRWQWRFHLQIHCHRCWKQWYSMWKDWASKLLTRLIMGEEKNILDIFILTLSVFLFCNHHCHFLSYPQRYWQLRLSVSHRAFHPYPAWIKEITGFIGLQATHSGSRCDRRYCGGKKKYCSIVIWKQRHFDTECCNFLHAGTDLKWNI